MNKQTELERLKSAARDTDVAARAAWDAHAAVWAAAREATAVATAAVEAVEAWAKAKE